MQNDLDLHGLTDNDMESPEQKQKAQRADRFSSFLLRHNLPKHGAASMIANKLGITPATVSAWIRGSMPRDPVVLFQFCDAFDICPYYWTTGIGRPRGGMDANRLIAADRELSDAIDKEAVILSVRQRLVLLADVYNDSQRGIERLTQLAMLLRDSNED